MQAGQRPMSRAQKLRWYAGQLMADASKAEKGGDVEAAISGYLQASDILLLLAKVEENYTAWKYYADTASQCQQNVRRLIAQRSGVERPPGVGAPSTQNTPPA